MMVPSSMNVKNGSEEKSAAKKGSTREGKKSECWGLRDLNEDC
jgi:hypothetical protein